MDSDWFLVFAFANAITAGMISVIPGEVLRPEISCSGTGFAAAMSRIGAAIGVFFAYVCCSTWSSISSLDRCWGVLNSNSNYLPIYA